MMRILEAVLGLGRIPTRNPALEAEGWHLVEVKPGHFYYLPPCPQRHKSLSPSNTIQPNT